MVTTGAGARVLLVASDRRVREALRDLLTAAAVGEVTATSDPDSALAHARARPPHVAIVALRLEKHGATAPLVGHMRDLGVRVLAVSGRSAVRSAAFGFGASAFVDTGADPDHLVSLVRQLAAGLSVKGDVHDSYFVD